MEDKGLLMPEMNEFGEYIVQIKEETVKTGGHFQSQSFLLDVPEESDVYNLDISFKIGIGILDAYSYIEQNMDGDELECVIGENTIVGTLANNTIVGDDIIKVSDSIFEYCDIGYYINLFNGTDFEDLGRIIEKDSENKIIKLENKIVKNFVVGDYIRMSIKLIPYAYLKGNTKLSFAYKRTGTNFLPSNRILRLKYKNNNNIAKRFMFMVEYLY
jgi:hypothetical protein